MTEIPAAGRERNYYIAERFFHWQRWDTWADQASTKPIVRFVRPDRQHPVLAPHWSTDDAMALELANVELPKRGWKVTLTTAADNDSATPIEEKRECLAVKWGSATFFHAKGATLADAVTSVVCQIAQAEKGTGDE